MGAYNWILLNPVRFARNLRWRLFSERSDWQFVFVISGPRNGTTLMQLILGSHSKGVHVDGEAGLHYYLQDLFDSKRFESYFNDAQIGELYNNSKDLKSFVENFYTLSGREGNDFFCTEKIPPHPFIHDLTMRTFPRAKFVTMVRDGRDAFCSALRHPGVRSSSADSIESFAKRWRKWTERTLKISHMPNAHLIKYEELTSDPEGCVDRLMEFVGFEFEEAQLSPETRAVHSKANQPHFSALSSPITSKSIGQYKSKLSAQEVRQFENVAGKTLVKCGYDLSSSKR